MLRYMLESPFGRWAEDGSRFIYDAAKVAAVTGYSPKEVETLGAPHCLTFPRQRAAGRNPQAHSSSRKP